MVSAYESILDHLIVGDELKTPDASSGKPFKIESVDPESVVVRTARGGRVKISLFTFDTALKFLEDHGCSGDRWLETKDENFQMVLNMENDRVRAASYVISILGRVGLIDIDGSRPNKVRLTAGARSE